MPAYRSPFRVIVTRYASSRARVRDDTVHVTVRHRRREPSPPVRARAPVTIVVHRARRIPSAADASRDIGAHCHRHRYRPDRTTYRAHIIISSYRPSSVIAYRYRTVTVISVSVTNRSPVSQRSRVRQFHPRHLSSSSVISPLIDRCHDHGPVIVVIVTVRPAYRYSCCRRSLRRISLSPSVVLAASRPPSPTTASAYALGPAGRASPAHRYRS